jgi:hypothetical protein
MENTLSENEETSVRSIDVIASVNSECVAKNNLFSSPLFRQGDVHLIVANGFSSIGKAYNHGISKAKQDILVFAHQDVYLPKGWHTVLENAVQQIEAIDNSWAVVGIIGVDERWRIRGRCWSTGLKQEIGNTINRPVPGVSFDEVVIILRRESGLTFDVDLPGFHLYGTDIVQAAIQAGFGAHIINAPVIHNSLPVTWLDSGFGNAYKYMQKKWSRQLPIKTPVTTITKYAWPLVKQRGRYLFSRKKREQHRRLANPSEKAIELGYESGL